MGTKSKEELKQVHIKIKSNYRYLHGNRNGFWNKRKQSNHKIHFLDVFLIFYLIKFSH